MFPADLSYDEINFGLSAVQRLRCLVDFAMSLHDEYDGRPESVIVSLVAVPQQRLDARIEEYLSEHRPELTVYRLRCSKCGREKLRSFDELDDHTCRCGGELEQVDDPAVQNERKLHEEAGFALARTCDPVSTKHTVSTWIVHKHTGSYGVPDNDITMPFGELLDHVTRGVREELAKIDFETPRIGACLSLSLSGRRRLLPQGSGLQEKLADYRDVRDRITGFHGQLLGLARDNAEFIEADECPVRKADFQDVIQLPVDMISDEPKEEAAGAAEADPRRERWLKAAEITQKANNVMRLRKRWPFWERYCEKHEIPLRRPKTKRGTTAKRRREVEANAFYRALRESIETGELDERRTEAEKRAQETLGRLDREFSPQAVVAEMFANDD